MDKEKVLFTLNSIIRQITCMKDCELEQHIISDGFNIDFCRYEFEKPMKVVTKIEMKVENL